MKKQNNLKPMVNQKKSNMSIFCKKKLVLLTVFILISMLALSCEKDNSVVFPPSLIGTWVTDELRYRDRYIDIDDLAITIGAGKNTKTLFFIDTIQKNIKESIVEWIFLCQNSDGTSFEFVIFHNSELDGNLLQLRNMKQIKWRKVQY